MMQINTLHKLKEESREEYLDRKLHLLSVIAHEQRILLVIDNFHPDHLEQLEPLRQIGWTVLLVSRERLPDGLLPSMYIDELSEEALVGMFSYYSQCDLDDKVNLSCFRKIMEKIGRHTLLTELIARQIAKSYLNLHLAEALVTGIGLCDLPHEKIDYVKDQKIYHGTLLKILDRLVETDHFTEQDRICLKLLSLFNMPGVEVDLFKTLAELDTLDLINDLEVSGWVKTEEQRLYLHPVMQEYIRTWNWTEASQSAADRLMWNLYTKIRPAGRRHDGSRQTPKDYESYYRQIRLIPQIVDNIRYVSEASQRLLYRWLMDSPVDQDTPVMYRMIDLLNDPRYLDDDSILRLYETTAYYRARLYNPDAAIDLLHKMKQYLRKHPSAYYLSAYHRAMAVILHNRNGNLNTILRHEDLVIATVKLSKHPEAQKQLIACLMNKARTLMSEEMDQKQVRKLIREANMLVDKYTSDTDYERYQFACNAAMCFAMDGDLNAAQAALDTADAIAFGAQDSDLSVAEHLIEEVAPIRMGMGQFDLAEAAVIWAICLCEKHLEAIRYRETVFDAYLFLGRIYAMDRDYIRAEKAFAEAEKRVHDSPYVWRLPLCPDDVRVEADRQRLEH